MKILYVSSPLKSNYGGGEKFIENLVTNLPNAQHSFLGGSKALFDVFEKLKMDATLSSAGLEPVTLKNLLLSPLSFISGLVHTLKFRSQFKDADIIVSPTSFTELFFVLPFVRIFWNKPMVFIIQNNRFPNSIAKSPLLPILKWMWNKYPVVFMSKSQENEWEKNGKLAQNSSVIHHGIEISNEKIVNHSEREEIVLGFLARIHQEKGLDTLLQALSEVQCNKKIILKIAGQGDYLNEIQNFAASLNFPKNVQIKWSGFVSDPKNFYDDLDLFVFPSRRESFGLVVTESWEKGVPVLCSNIPVFEELKNLQICDQEKLLLHEVDDYRDLAAKIEEFAEKISFWREAETKLSIRETVLANFKIQDMANSYNQVFEKEMKARL